MGLTKGRSIRRHNKKQTKRGNGNKYNDKYNGGGVAEGDLPPNATPAQVSEAVKQFKGLDAKPAMKYMEDYNRKGGIELPSGSVFLIMGGIALVCGVIALPIILKS
jgi:hypothetical protein